MSSCDRGLCGIILEGRNSNPTSLVYGTHFFYPSRWQAKACPLHQPVRGEEVMVYRQHVARRVRPSSIVHYVIPCEARNSWSILWKEESDQRQCLLSQPMRGEEITV